MSKTMQQSASILYVAICDHSKLDSKQLDLNGHTVASTLKTAAIGFPFSCKHIQNRKAQYHQM